MRVTKKVHHLVLEAFHGPRPTGLHGCHNNGDPLDNRAGNLRWDTQSGNMRDFHRHKGLTECVNGHDITDPENVYANAPGRKCKLCQRARANARRLGIEDYRTLL